MSDLESKRRCDVRSHNSYVCVFIWKKEFQESIIVTIFKFLTGFYLLTDNVHCHAPPTTLPFSLHSIVTCSLHLYILLCTLTNYLYIVQCPAQSLRNGIEIPWMELPEQWFELCGGFFCMFLNVCLLLDHIQSCAQSALGSSSKIQK